MQLGRLGRWQTNALTIRPPPPPCLLLVVVCVKGGRGGELFVSLQETLGMVTAF